MPCDGNASTMQGKQFIAGKCLCIRIPPHGNERTDKRQPENRNYALNYAFNNALNYPRELCVTVER